MNSAVTGGAGVPGFFERLPRPDFASLDAGPVTMLPVKEASSTFPGVEASPDSAVAAAAVAALRMASSCPGAISCVAAVELESAASEEYIALIAATSDMAGVADSAAAAVGAAVVAPVAVAGVAVVAAALVVAGVDDGAQGAAHAARLSSGARDKLGSIELAPTADSRLCFPGAAAVGADAAAPAARALAASSMRFEWGPARSASLSEACSDFELDFAAGVFGDNAGVSVIDAHVSAAVA